MSKNLSSLSGRKGLHSNLFDQLGQLAADTGTPREEDLQKLADEFLIGAANTYGSATFYDFTKPENRGKKVYVCNGSVCLCAGTQERLVDDLKQYFREEEIGEMCCLGRCHENAAFHYNGKNYSAATPQSIAEIVSGTGTNRDQYNATALGRALLTAPFDGIETFREALQQVFSTSPEDIIATVKTSGLRGRGGAGFPMGMKFEFCRNAPGDTKFIICNADEGDPGAYSDRYLLEERPYSVLFGMLAGGYAIGANWGVLYIRAEYPESVMIIEDAIRTLAQHQLTGDNILGSGFNFRFKIIKAQGAYICGEETALINSIEGQRPEVRTRPPYPAQYGLFGKPTVVNNVETLASLYWIMQHGGDAYAQIGTQKSPGTKLVCLDSRFRNPGCYEVEMGTPLRDVIEKCGHGFKVSVKALHIGGPLGGLVPIHKVDDLTLDFESFANAGFLLGHASIVSIPGDFPMIKYLEHLFEFAAHESCGKCFPCRLGTKRAEEMLAKAQHEDYKIDRTLFDDLLHTLQIGSLCAHGGGIPLPVRNALEYFEEELKGYFS